jgi:hypothetical protein
MSYANGNGAARPVIVVRGRSLAHRTKLSKQQRAVIAADIFDGAKQYQQTRRELTLLLGVSGAMIDRARRLTAEQRQRVASGLVSLAHFDKSPRPLALPKPGNGTAIDDKTLFDVIAAAGIDRVLSIAANVDQARH